jgi:hypothetical protein
MRVGHIGLYRDPATLEPVEYYYKVPEDIADRLVIVVDPMLATGNSAAAAITRLKQGGAKSIKFVCLLAAPEGIKVMQNAHPDVPVITASIDQCLNDHGYIVRAWAMPVTACSAPNKFKRIAPAASQRRGFFVSVFRMTYLFPCTEYDNDRQFHSCFQIT